MFANLDHNKMNAPSENFQEKNNYVFKKPSDLNRLTEKQKMLFSWIDTNDFLSIKNSKWDVEEDFSSYNDQKQNPIYLASVKKREEILSYLYEEVGRQIFTNGVQRDRKHRTQLYWAAACGRYFEIAADIPSYDINTVTQNGSSPIYIASQNGHLEVVKLLIERGANVNLADAFGRTAVYIASQNGHLEIVKELIKANANITHPTNQGYISLCVAALQGHLEIVKILLDKNVSPTSHDMVFLALCLAGENNHEEISQFLLEKFNVNQLLKNGDSPLLYAVKNNKINTVKALIASGADIYQITRDGTLLNLAASNGYLEITQLILEADINHPYHFAKKSLGVFLKFAIEGNYFNLVKNLVEKIKIHSLVFRNGTTPLIAAVHTGNLKMVEILVEKNAPIDIADNNGVTPLYIASEQNLEEIVVYLIKKNADVNKQTFHVTPLWIAAKKGHDAVVKHLINANADFNQTGLNSTTPLFIACERGHSKIVQTLVSKGARLNQFNVYGVTPLFVAAYKGYYEIVKILLEAGASIDLKYNSHTPLEIAEIKKNTQSFALLKMWQIKKESAKLDLVDQIIAILETNILLENQPSTNTFFLYKKEQMYQQLKMSKLTPKCKNAIISLELIKHRSDIPLEKYNFIFKYLLGESESLEPGAKRLKFSH